MLGPGKARRAGNTRFLKPRIMVVVQVVERGKLRCDFLLRPFTCDLGLDWAPKEKSFSCWCMFTFIEERIDDRDWEEQDQMITAILLDRAEVKGSWVRIEMTKMKNLFRLKMRYKMWHDGKSRSTSRSRVTGPILSTNSNLNRNSTQPNPQIPILMPCPTRAMPTTTAATTTTTTTTTE